MKTKAKYEVAYDKWSKRWGVYDETDWVCDCVDKETAKRICRLLNLATE